MSKRDSLMVDYVRLKRDRDGLCPSPYRDRLTKEMRSLVGRIREMDKENPPRKPSPFVRVKKVIQVKTKVPPTPKKIPPLPLKDYEIVIFKITKEKQWRCQINNKEEFRKLVPTTFKEAWYSVNKSTGKLSKTK